jgi:hypothetical protein
VRAVFLQFPDSSRGGDFDSDNDGGGNQDEDETVALIILCSTLLRHF